MKNTLTALLFIFSSSVFSYGNKETGFLLPTQSTVRINEEGYCRNVANAHAVRYYFLSAKTSAEWLSFITHPPAGVTLTTCATTYKSCLDHKKANPTATSGKYTIDPDGVGVGYPPVDVYCDMTTDGGGWTLVWSNTRTGTNKFATNMNWNTSTKTTPLCSQAQGAGVGCATYLTGNKEGFNYFIGLDWWTRITGQNKNSEMMYEWSSNFGNPIEQSGKFNIKRTNESKLYSTEASNYTQMTGSVIPGIYSYHYSNNASFSTIDVNNSLNPLSCMDSSGNTPFWYTSCWTGNINGGGELLGGTHFNGAYYLGSVRAWGDSNGVGAGNGWLFVREYQYLTNCTEIKYRNPNAPDGYYWIDPDGSGGNPPIFAKCDMTNDGGGWTLLFNQHYLTGGFFTDATQAESHNITKPDSNLYSILSLTEGFRSLKGSFTFKINWPGYAQKNIWKQRSNPFIDQPIAGYIPLSIDSSSEGWGGLERDCTTSCDDSLINGSTGSSTFAYNIGSYADYTTGGGHGIKASSTVSATGVPHAQLWTRDDSFILKTPRDCQDILEYGQSIGNGLYWVDPTGSGTSMQVYCDMTSDGGGWTLVFNHNIAGGYFATPASALSSNPTNPTANQYSILDKLDNFKANGRYIFKINWPIQNKRNIWIQTTNPTIDQAVAGYVPLAIDFSNNDWGGLERNCTISCEKAFMDGAVGSADWFYSIGVYAAWGTPTTGIPATSTIAGGSGVAQAQLWTRRSEGQFTKRSCKEILDSGLSTGDGSYFIDPDGVGGQLPFRVYCDMTTSGGGWTRVAYSKGATVPTPVTGDFFAKEYRKSLLGLTTVSPASSSINTEWFSRVVGTTDAMLIAPAYTGSPYIDIGLGIWQYDTERCTGVLRHTSRTAGCPGQSANDNWNNSDMFNIAVNGGNEAIVPNYSHLCYNGKGGCDMEFYLR